ncbi:CAAX prenyl protease 1 homolog isoform X1 [Drosophila montana]|uniref:CAAX prenyl protease 1 homolog isoform X1 n=2 Tax=Drosophila montana TaxID=40370 RepID=UPI00313C69EB
MVFYDTWPKLEPRHLLYILMLVLFIDHIWEIILAKRQQLTCLGAITVPEELRGIIPPEIFHRARIYELHKMELFIWKHVMDVIISLLELYFGFYPFVWGLATSTLASLTDKEIWISLIFVFYLTIYITLRCLPVLLYDKCILELRYGTQQRFPCYIYFCMGLLSIVLSQIVLAPLTLLIVFSVQAIGYYFFLYFWLMWALFTIFLVFFLPYLCIPCIGHQRRLPPGSLLYADIKQVCDVTGFPMSRVFIIRTKSMQYSNAYFYGSCCLKRIVIFDTLLYNKGLPIQELQPYEVGRGLTNPQVVAVVAHELGHWRKGHFYKATFIMKVHFLLTMVLFGLLFHCPQLYQAVGFVPGLCPIIVGFIIVLRFAMTPYLTLANFLMLWNLRRFEYAADRFAHRLGYSMQLRLALIKIYADHMSFPVYDSCYARWHHTHPTILQRLAYQQRLDAEAYYNT